MSLHCRSRPDEWGQGVAKIWGEKRTKDTHKSKNIQDTIGDKRKMSFFLSTIRKKGQIM